MLFEPWKAGRHWVNAPYSGGENMVLMLHLGPAFLLAGGISAAASGPCLLCFKLFGTIVIPDNPAMITR